VHRAGARQPREGNLSWDRDLLAHGVLAALSSAGMYTYCAAALTSYYTICSGLSSTNQSNPQGGCKWHKWS